MKKTKRPTIQDVAQRAGVSISTVSRVINQDPDLRVRKSTQRRVLSAIAELEYTPVKAARNLRRQRTHVLALLLPDISNPFFSLLARGVESVAFQAGYSTLICDSDNSLERESRHVSALLSEDVDGLVLVPVGVFAQQNLQRLRRSDTPVVVADRRVSEAVNVEADNATGSLELANYLLELGYTRFAYVGGPRGVSTAEDRLQGFLRAMQQARIEPVAVVSGDFTYEAGLALGDEVLRSHDVDVVAAGNDLMAIGAAHAAEALDIRIPGDLGVAGFDGVSWASLVRPRLTTVRVPFFEMGQEAARLLIDLLVSGDASVNDRKLPVTVVPGDSTCAQA